MNAPLSGSAAFPFPRRFFKWKVPFLSLLRRACPRMYASLYAADSGLAAWLYPLERLLPTSEVSRFRWIVAVRASVALSTISTALLVAISLYDVWRIGAGGCPGCALTSVWGSDVPDEPEARLSFDISAALHCEACFRARRPNLLLGGAAACPGGIADDDDAAIRASLEDRCYDPGWILLSARIEACDEAPCPLW